MPQFTLATRLDGALGGATARALQRAFDMHTVGELLAHYPRRYLRMGELTPIDELAVGEQATILARVERAEAHPMRSRKGVIVEAVITDGHSRITLTFFNQRFRLAELVPGRMGIFSGTVGVYRNGRQFTHPHYEMLDDDGTAPDAAHDAAQARAMAPLPVYAATASVTSRKIQTAVAYALDGLGPVADPVPEELRERLGLLTASAALERIHRPKAEDEVPAARRTLRMQEALVLQTALLQQREVVRATSATPRPGGDLLARFDAALPFSRTPDQVTVGDAIEADLVGAWPMNRLVQGEVGSGKTLVALRAMLQVAQSGGQSALIAPTEVLAGQHLRSITRMLGPDLCAELLPTLVTGQLPAAQRRRAALRTASGQSRIVVGTHALLTSATTFADLGLVVVDEQHRFGVEQRETLRAKGSGVHALVLTATPIPRTVAMTVFGDLDVSTIRTMPPGRAGVQTFVAPLAEKPAWFHRVWARVAEEVAQGRRVFVVCPAIDVEAKSGGVEDEALPAASDAGDEPARTRWGVVQVERLLAQHPAFADIRVGVLHGRMPSDEKDAVMRAFSGGDLDVLVATTVVEVGVDVPQASTMVILEADRFGVSQLHQLRGRVGRGGIPGLCLLVTEAPQGTPARERVDAVARTADGFELAEVDLRLRGEGDVLGDLQSGARSSLRLLRVVQDADLITLARAEGEKILAADPALRTHPGLAEAIERRLDEDARAALAKS